jgi:hypothetical protein
MKRNPVLLSLIVILAGAVPLAASEAIWEVNLTVDLPPSAFVFPDPLPKPGPMALLPDVALVPPPQDFSVPVRIPVYGPSVRSGKALFDANLALMVGLNVADYITTRQALKYPGVYETNPIMRPFVKSPAAFAAIKAGTTALTYFGFKSIFKKNRTFAWVMSTASNALLSYVVANNVRQIQAARTR